MDITLLLGIAVGLALDAFSVCVVAGANIQRISLRHYFRLAFHFGLFQFFMPIIGFYTGSVVEGIIYRVDHWIAFGLLVLIGIKMILESYKKSENSKNFKDPSRGLLLVMFSIATSIDAAAVGFSLAALKIPILSPSIIIGVVCGIFSVIGLYLGKTIGSYLGSWAERLGGLVLIIIGIKILIEHLG